MKKRIKKELFLDDYERELSKAIEAGEFVPIENEAAEIAKFREAARNTLASKSICIRIDDEVLDKIRVKAKEYGLPYQTLIKTVLYKYAQDKINLGL